MVYLFNAAAVVDLQEIKDLFLIRSEVAKLEEVVVVMEDDSSKEVKHILLGKFKDEVTEDEIEELINRYGQLVSIIPPMKDFKWGTKVSIRDLDQGFTHVFESTFDSIHGVTVFLDHPAHVQFKNQFVPRLDKLLVIDYVLHP